jgi:hypothetical protein
MTELRNILTTSCFDVVVGYIFFLPYMLWSIRGRPSFGSRYWFVYIAVLVTSGEAETTGLLVLVLVCTAEWNSLQVDCCGYMRCISPGGVWCIWHKTINTRKIQLVRYIKDWEYCMYMLFSDYLLCCYGWDVYGLLFCFRLSWLSMWVASRVLLHSTGIFVY